MEKKTEQFDYLTHYANDPEEFDYFEKRTGATFDEEKRLREVIGLQVPKNIKRILDVGCGQGWVAKKFLPKNKQVISLDVSKSNPSKIQELYSNKNNLSIVGDSFHLPFISGSIDCVIASEVIEHVIN